MFEVQPTSRPPPAAQQGEEESEPAPPEPGGEQAGAGDHVLHQQKKLRPRGRSPGHRTVTSGDPW